MTEQRTVPYRCNKCGKDLRDCDGPECVGPEQFAFRMMVYPEAFGLDTHFEERPDGTCAVYLTVLPDEQARRDARPPYADAMKKALETTRET